MTKRNGLIGAALVCLCLAASAQAATPLPDEALDFSYRRVILHRKTGPEHGPLHMFIRVSRLDDKLKVCGIYFADRSESGFRQVQNELHDINSIMRFGAEGAGVIVRPGFLDGRREPPPMDALRVSQGAPLADMPTHCVRTDEAWRDRYATEPFLVRLAETSMQIRRKL